MGSVLKKVLLSIVAVFVLVIFNVYLAEAQSLKKGEVYRTLDGKVIEVISSSELELTEGKETTIAKYGFKDDKLRAVIGDKVIYFEISKEGLKEGNTGTIYYSKAVLADLKEKGKFKDNGNGTVTDRTTKFMWQQGEGGKKNWDSAVAYCKSLSLAGHNDWRLPNIEELQSIIDKNAPGPKIDKTYFPNAISSNYWSSSTFEGNNAVGMYFGAGGGAGGYAMADTGNIRCIRGGQ